MVEPDPEIWVPVQASYRRQHNVFFVFWTKLFWRRIRSHNVQDVGAVAKKIDARSWSRSLKFEITENRASDERDRAPLSSRCKSSNRDGSQTSLRADCAAAALRVSVKSCAAVTIYPCHRAWQRSKFF